MATNIAQMDELKGKLLDLDKTTNGTLHFFNTFKLAKLLSVFDRIKGKGADVSSLLLSLIVFRLRNERISLMQRPWSFTRSAGKSSPCSRNAICTFASMSPDESNEYPLFLKVEFILLVTEFVKKVQLEAVNPEWLRSWDRSTERLVL
jgi:hypothetical protein